MLVKALVNLIVSIDLSDEETVDSDFASSAFEDVMAAFEELSEGDRVVISQIIQSMAESESSSARREALLELPESFGLIDEDD
ncbi:hypothetical protein ACWDFR_45430 [Streptomyces sp. 900105755]